MNSEEYIEVSVKLDPFSEEMAEILTAELSELPFDSFVTEEPYLKCYIQKEAYKPSDVKVVVLSALNSNEDIVKAFNLGATDFITKPILMDKLCNAVAKVLEIPLKADSGQ